MDTNAVIAFFYPEDTALRRMLLKHSESIARFDGLLSIFPISHMSNFANHVAMPQEIESV